MSAPEECNGRDDDLDQVVDEGACPCPSIVYQSSLYLFCDDLKTWREARDSCRGMGFDLCSIHSNPENQVLYNQLSLRELSDTWIGLNDRDQEEVFMWSNNEELSYTRWGNGEPNNGGSGENCGIILMRGNRRSFWDDRSCLSEYSYICEYEIPAP